MMRLLVPTGRIRMQLEKVFIFGGEGGKEVRYTVVGIVSNEHQFGPDAATHAQIYLPGHHMQGMSLVVRVAGDPLASANAVKQEIWAIDKDEPVSQVDSMENVLHEWTAPRRFNMTVLAQLRRDCTRACGYRALQRAGLFGEPANS